MGWSWLTLGVIWFQFSVDSGNLSSKVIRFAEMILQLSKQTTLGLCSLVFFRHIELWYCKGLLNSQKLQKHQTFQFYKIQNIVRSSRPISAIKILDAPTYFLGLTSDSEYSSGISIIVGACLGHSSIISNFFSEQQLQKVFENVQIDDLVWKV